jgi:hypothetical protein
MTTGGELLRFANGVLQNYRALADWVRPTARSLRRGWISLDEAWLLRKSLDTKARALVEVTRLLPELLAAQRELDKAFEERHKRDRAAFFSDHPNEEEV